MKAQDHAEQLARQFRALGNPERLRLLMLARTPSAFPDNMVDALEVGVCVNDLARAARLPQSTASRHLTVLHQSGLVEVTRHRQWRYVRPSETGLRPLADAMTELIDGYGEESP